MGLTKSPRVYCSQDDEDEVAVILTWNKMSSAREYLTKAHFTRSDDEGKHEESLNQYLSNTHLFAINEEGVKAIAAGGNVVYSGGAIKVLKPGVTEKVMKPEVTDKYMKPGVTEKVMKPEVTDKYMKPGVTEK
ncbi:MAG: hypothetical protein ACW99A_20690, partial [Candidatus Kariarchaeaceae archaeon]